MFLYRIIHTQVNLKNLLGRINFLVLTGEFCREIIRIFFFIKWLCLKNLNNFLNISQSELSPCKPRSEEGGKTRRQIQTRWTTNKETINWKPTYLPDGTFHEDGDEYSVSLLENQEEAKRRRHRIFIKQKGSLIEFWKLPSRLPQESMKPPTQLANRYTICQRDKQSRPIGKTPLLKAEWGNITASMEAIGQRTIRGNRRRVVGYMDNLMLIVRGQFQDTLMRITQRILGNVKNQCAKPSISVIPKQIEVPVFRDAANGTEVVKLFLPTEWEGTATQH